jgi:hypothetical protein
MLRSNQQGDEPARKWPKANLGPGGFKKEHGARITGTSYRKESEDGKTAVVKRSKTPATSAYDRDVPVDADKEKSLARRKPSG